MIDLVTHSYALILDPLEELTNALGRVEDWLLFSDPEPGQAVATVRAGAHATAALSRSITETDAQAPALYAPNNRIELAPLAIAQRDLTSALAAVRRAVQTLPSERPLARTLPSLDLLHRCAVSSRSAQAARITAVRLACAGDSPRRAAVGYNRGRVMFLGGASWGWRYCVTATTAEPHARRLRCGLDALHQTRHSTRRVNAHRSLLGTQDGERRSAGVGN